jgi:hypothetical protein
MSLFENDLYASNNRNQIGIDTAMIETSVFIAAIDAQ